jgi:hypothetical protein
MLWTSGSFGSRAGGAATSCGVSLTGLVRLGSSPALTAFRMRRAWYFAYLVFDVISGSSFFHMDRISRKVEAARSVSAVWLACGQYLGVSCRIAKPTWLPCPRSCPCRPLQTSAGRIARSRRSRRRRRGAHLQWDAGPWPAPASPSGPSCRRCIQRRPSACRRQ